jgi:hypothetical protein
LSKTFKRGLRRMSRIYFRGNRDELNTVFRNMVASIAGSSQTYRTEAQAIHAVVGLSALSDIKADFVRKARGETGEDGIKWAPLSPKTLAYGRKAPKAGGLAPGGKDGFLTAEQLARWRRIYGGTLSRLAMSMPLETAKGKAAAKAWFILKQEGAKTKLSEYANRPHEILRDTGILLNSLSPGAIGSDGVNLTVSPPRGEGGDLQVFDLTPAGVIVGTNVPYAGVHQNGSRKRNIPARPFIPNVVPDKWLERWTGAVLPSLTVAIRQAVEAV